MQQGAPLVSGLAADCVACASCAAFAAVVEAGWICADALLLSSVDLLIIDCF